MWHRLLVVTGSDVDEDFLRRLERRAEDLIEQTSPDRAEQGRLQAYLAVVRAAR
jgi:hypothetical protein